MKNNKYNRLINEKSPYLLQHAENPVDWYPWGEEAFKKAKKEDKPILLSIGYSTCHWCHVMAHESFSDKETAQYLNENFVSIKVDREERPDIDDTYMLASQLMTGTGGWPLNIIMTPDKIPFYAGTYSPLKSRYNMPSFLQILKEINGLWKNNRIRLIEDGHKVLDNIRFAQDSGSAQIPKKDIFDKSLMVYSRIFDAEYGGFSREPKFPMPHNISFLLGLYKSQDGDTALYMAERTLLSLYEGGIFDHVGGGFHRYSTDRYWLIPHFEKMLYDQALISIAYLEAYQITGNDVFANVARRTLDYVLREMKDPDGGFYCGTDADSEGIEGKFFVWKKSEIDEILGQDSEIFCKFYGITENGNFEGSQNILSIQSTLNDVVAEFNKDVYQVNEILNSFLNKLYEEREKRIHPHLDDKVITGWNGLVIKALALASKVLNDEKYQKAAVGCFNFIDKNLKTSEGRLLRRYRDGESSINAFLEDYAYLIYGLLELYEATFNEKYLEEIINLINIVIQDFHDEENKAFLTISKHSEVPLVNIKDAYDGAIPSASSILFSALLKITDITEDKEYLTFAEEIAGVYGDRIVNDPVSHSQILSGLLYYYGNHKVITVYQNSKDPENYKIIDLLRKHYSIDAVLVAKTEDKNKTTVDICEKTGCKKPIESFEELTMRVKEL
ncbi:MAG: hypothetical protein A2Y25_08320 [Candidatus Melainabacteria bacterium GWF2_37_15]|nr:MAG: hypothetical protein A2Y25_08320 [Candidatus Melainabacteria bacterium GWF2_37_15]